MQHLPLSLYLWSIHIYLAEIILCGICSIVFYKKGTQAEKTLVPFFILLMGIESYCYYLYLHNISRDTVYNLWFPVEFGFYCFFICSYLENAFRKKQLQIITILYVLLVALYYSTICNLVIFSSKAFIVGVLVLVAVLLNRLYEMLNAAVMEHPLKNPLFWFIFGLLLVNLGSFFILGSTNYLNITNKAFLSAIGYLDILFTDIEYFCFLLYFYCKWKYQKSVTL